MSETENDSNTAPAKSGGKAILLAAPVALLAGGLGFAVMFLDLLGLQKADTAAVPEMTDSSFPKEDGKTPKFVPVTQITMSVGPPNRLNMLRFAAQLEVEEGYEDEVAALEPRILDVLHTYLMAIDPATLQRPSSLITLRAQMLRRIQLVTGPGRVRDLLITEFLLS